MPTGSASAILELSSELPFKELDLRDQSSPDGAITILLSDIEGASALMERLGERAWLEVLREQNAIVRRLLEEHDGTEIESRRDGMMVTFRSAHAGLRYAIAAQRACTGRVAGRLVRPRVGLHSGFVIQEGEDFLGRNVVLAARLADRARGGEILVSSALKEYTENDPTFEFEYRGNVHFRGMLGEHAVYAVRWEHGA